MKKRIPAIFISVLLILNFSACNYVPEENAQNKTKQSSSETSNSSKNLETLLDPSFSSSPFLCVAEGSDPLTDDEIRSMIRDLPDSQYETYPELHNVPIAATLYKEDKVISVSLDDTRLMSLINFYNNSVYHHQYSYTQGFLSIDYLETNVLNEDLRLALTFATKNNASSVSYDTQIQAYDTMVITNEWFVLIGHDLPGYEDSEDRYHNTIDAVGDKAATEDRVFDACEQAVTEIKNLVRLITNDMNGTNIIITSDHGFLYSYKPLDESDKAEKSFVSGRIVELDRRYVIADGECSADHMLRLPMTRMNSNLTVFTPLDNIRMKKQGGGMNYVHGGVSLQESVVPVIEFKNLRPTSKKFVDVKNVTLQLISRSRKVSNSIFSLDFYQKEAVSGKISAATYEIYMADAAGKPVSDKKMIIADKTSGNGADRVFRIKLTLKSVEFKKTDTYYLTVAEKDTANVVERIEFMIDIAFVNDFDF